MNRSPRIAVRQCRSRQRGLTLVELMVAVTINLFVVAGLLVLLMNQALTRDEMAKATQGMESGRHASRMLRESIQHAGYYGNYFDVPTPAAAPDACATTVAALKAGIQLPLHGMAGAATSPLLACIAQANYVPGTDVLIVRRADTRGVDLATAAADVKGRAYLQGLGAQAVVDVATNATAAVFTLKYKTSTLTGPVELRRLLVHIYFVSPCRDMANGATCAATDDGGRPIPTLKRLELGATATAPRLDIVPVAEGIENLQIDYGLDQDDDGFADQYVAAPATLADWGRAVAVRFHLLARNTDPSPSYQDTKTYDLGGAARVGPFEDAFKRHVYVDTVRAVNLAGRKATE